MGAVNPYLASAAALAFLTGLVHSILGERRIFHRLRRDGQWIPTEGGAVLPPFQVRILWASWHGITAFGWGAAAILAGLALRPTRDLLVLAAIALAMAATAALVLFGTRGRHPGWIALLAIALLAALGALR